MRKLFLLLVVAMFALIVGCSGNAGVTPDDRATMEEFFNSITYDDSIAGSFWVTDLEDNIVFESTLIRAEDGSLQLGEVRNGDIIIDFTWLNWIDVQCDYLNPVGFTYDGRAIYYIGMTMQYKLTIENVGINIYNGSVRAQQRYLGGPYHWQLLPGASTEWWTGQYFPVGNTFLYDDYFIPPGTYPGNDVTHVMVGVPIDIWCLHFDIILYSCAPGLWDP